jgi:hypothetical protein
MATRGTPVTLPAPLAGVRGLRVVVAAGLVLGVTSCASADVEHIVKHDAAATGGAGGTGGSGGSGGGQGGGGGGGTGGQTTSTTGVCDPFSNSGCASDQKCTALQRGPALELGCGTKGNLSAGETCTPVSPGGVQTGDDCGNGLACFRLGTETSSTCHRICASAASSPCACAPEEICSLLVSGLDSLGYAFCRPVAKCQALEQTGCAGTEGCYFTTSSCYTGPQCAGKGSKNPGDACGAANDCTPGSTCLIVGTTGICSSFCSTADGGPKCSGASTGGDICAALGGPDPNLGSCRQQP